MDQQKIFARFVVINFLIIPIFLTVTIRIDFGLTIINIMDLDHL